MATEHPSPDFKFMHTHTHTQPPTVLHNVLRWPCSGIKSHLWRVAAHACTRTGGGVLQGWGAERAPPS